MVSEEDAIYDESTLIAARPDTEDPFMGMFAQEPELIEQLIAAAMQPHRMTPLRVING